MGLTVHINDGKAHDKKGENKSEVNLSTSSAGLAVNINMSPSATFKPTFSIKQTEVIEWRIGDQAKLVMIFVSPMKQLVEIFSSLSMVVAKLK